MAAQKISGAQLLEESEGNIKLHSVVDGDTQKYSWQIEVKRGKYELAIDNGLSDHAALMKDSLLYVNASTYTKLRDIVFTESTFQKLSIIII